MELINQIYLSGFKSISAMKPLDLTLGRINILLGANGSGKSNLISYFGMLTNLYNRTFQNYAAQFGAQTLLHGGPQYTGGIKTSVRCVDTDNAERAAVYNVALNFGVPNRLFIAEETVWPKGRPQSYMVYSDTNESGLQGCLQDPGAQLIASLLSRICIYQFNNTAMGSSIRLPSGKYDCAALRVDGGNLASYLNQLKTAEPYFQYYRRIVTMIRSVMPQFNDFDFRPTADGSVWLTWTDRNHPGYLLGPHQLSDGTLRFMALAAALLSPPQLMPKVLILDEPELGLHPFAVGKLSGMIKMASVHSQVIVATQSAKLVDAFDIEDVRVVDWDRGIGCSVIKKLNPADFAAWTERYNSISDLWEKNLIGGQP